MFRRKSVKHWVIVFKTELLGVEMLEMSAHTDEVWRFSVIESSFTFKLV